MSATAVLLTVIAYFAAMMVVSWLSGRGNDNAGFFTGARKTQWWVVAFAMIGSTMSGVTYVSVPGMVGVSGFGYLQMCLGFFVGYLVIAFVLTPIYFRLNLVSIYGYLDQRFGVSSYKTGAWFFFISKMLGASVRLFLVCLTLQLLVFDPFGLPFWLNVVVSMLIVLAYTFRGGVKSVISGDTLKTFCMIVSVVLCIVFIARALGYGVGDMVKAVAADDTSRIFFFDNPKEGTYFWKQFIAGIFMVIATTGLDQDLMQRTLASKNVAESKKGLIVSGITQIFVVGLFLVLGTLLVMYTRHAGIEMPEKNDALFGLVAQDSSMPIIMLILFVLGLIAAGYSAAGSALTALTTSFTVDILESDKKQEEAQLARTRRMVHIGMAVVMGLIILVFYALNNDSAIKMVYTLASYTYGPILGLFAFGMMCKKPVRDRLVPVVCIAAPILSFFIQMWLKNQFDYTLGFELLLLNAALTMIGLALLIKKGSAKE